LANRTLYGPDEQTDSRIASSAFLEAHHLLADLGERLHLRGLLPLPR